MLFQRLGTLQPVKQGHWQSAPAREGLWAFPWPYFSMFFAAHQLGPHKPRRFKRGSVGPVDRCWWTHDGKPAPRTPSEPELAADSAGRWQIVDEWDSAKWLDDYERWYDKDYKRVMKIRRFWYAGDVYTHLDEKGHDLGLRDWRIVDATEFVLRASRYIVRECRWHETRRPMRICKYHKESLEVFLPVRGSFGGTPPRRTRRGGEGTLEL